MATNEEPKRGSDDEDRLRSLLGAADRDLTEGELIEKYVVPWRTIGPLGRGWGRP